LLARWAVQISAVEPEGLRFRHLRALVSGWIERDLPTELHRANRKPFTISPLIGGDDSTATLHVTTLTREAADAMASAMTRIVETDRLVRIGPNPAQITNDADVPAEVTGYAKLVDAAATDAAGLDEITFETLSPVMFLSGRQPANPLPIPTLVFGHLRDRWQAFSDVELKAFDLRESGLHVRWFDGHTTAASLGFRRPDGKWIDRDFPGFTGRVTYGLVARSRWIRHTFHAHARLAEFTGVGANTTLGFGAVRRQDPANNTATKAAT